MISERLRRGPAYLAVSVTCVLLNNALLIGLDRLSVHYVISVLISAAVMIPLSFGLHVRFTYAVKPSPASFWRYASVLIVNTPAAWLLFFVVHDRGGLAMTLAAPIVTFILFVWNFAASDWAIISRSRRDLLKERP